MRYPAGMERNAEQGRRLAACRILSLIPPIGVVAYLLTMAALANAEADKREVIEKRTQGKVQRVGQRKDPELGTSLVVYLDDPRDFLLRLPEWKTGSDWTIVSDRPQQGSDLFVAALTRTLAAPVPNRKTQSAADYNCRPRRGGWLGIGICAFLVGTPE
jgi:hypothetical protein